MTDAQSNEVDLEDLQSMLAVFATRHADAHEIDDQVWASETHDALVLMTVGAHPFPQILLTGLVACAAGDAELTARWAAVENRKLLVGRLYGDPRPDGRLTIVVRDSVPDMLFDAVVVAVQWLAMLFEAIRAQTSALRPFAVAKLDARIPDLDIHRGEIISVAGERLGPQDVQPFD